MFGLMALLVGTLIGGVLGLTGAGGSVLAVPLLVILLELPLIEATGLSLGAVFTSASLGVVLRLKQGQIQWLPAIMLAFFGAVSAPFGRHLANLMSELLLATSFLVLVVWVAYRMWQQAMLHPASSAAVRANISREPVVKGSGPKCSGQSLTLANFKLTCFMRIAAAGLLTGVLSGIYGVGGGFVIVPVLVSILGMDIKYAVASSLVVIVLVSASGFVSFIFSPVFSFAHFWPLALGGGIGMFAGVAGSRYLAGPILQRIFALALPLMSALMLSKILS